MSVSSDTFISVVVRTKNSARTLQSCLEALCAVPEVRQIVVVDSGSKDETIKIAKACSLVELQLYPPDKQFNYSAALNIGIRTTRHPWICLISSHVILTQPNSLMERMLTEMGNERCAGAYIRPGYVGRLLVDIKNFDGRNGLSNSCGMIRRSQWEKHPFLESIPACEDQEYTSYWVKKGKYFMRIGSDQIRYLNPYSHPWKQIRDEMVICRDIHPPLRNLNNYKQKARKLFHSLRKGDLGGAYWGGVGIVMLALSRFVRFRLKSAYRKGLS